MTKLADKIEALEVDPVMIAFIGTVEEVDPDAAKGMREHLADGADERLVKWLVVFNRTFTLRAREANQ